MTIAGQRFVLPQASRFNEAAAVCGGSRESLDVCCCVPSIFLNNAAAILRRLKIAVDFLLHESAVVHVFDLLSKEFPQIDYRLPCVCTVSPFKACWYLKVKNLTDACTTAWYSIWASLIGAPLMAVSVKIMPKNKNVETPAKSRSYSVPLT